MTKKTIRIGTRGSKLALAQAKEAALALQKRGYETEISVFSTKGDEQSALLSQLGRGAFTDVLSEKLHSGAIDLAVHSAKDLPTDAEKDDFYCLARADARDALVCVKGGRAIVRIGTGSARRMQAMRRLYPQAEILPVRGNVDTRLKKLLCGEFDALVLAMAGLTRLNIEDERLEIKPICVADCVPAACQGIIALEGEIGKEINDESVRIIASIERSCQRALGGDCTGGAGAYFDGRTLYAQKEGRIEQMPYEGAKTIGQIAEKLQ